MGRVRLSALVMAVLASAALAGTAQATTVTQADLTQGLSSVSVDGFTITTTGNTGTGFFDHKTSDGVTGGRRRWQRIDRGW